jgi:glycosyltransferase involved in cell wall biosynthesis
MRIGIDNISPGTSTRAGTLGGMRAYLEDLMEFLPVQISEATFKLFTPAGSLFDDISLANNIHLVPCVGVPSGRVRRALYEQIVLPRLIRKEKLDLWLGICNVLPLVCPCPSVVIIQSLQYFSFPSAYAPLQRYYLRLLVTLSAKRANRIIALSNAARYMILTRFHLPEDKVVVAQNGLSQALSKQLNTPDSDRATELIHLLTGGRPYLLSVSAFYEYKNLPRLIRAFAQVSSVLAHQLVLVGAETPYVTTDSLRNLARHLDVQDRVIFAGRIPHEEIAAFYRHASALIMPSLEETFGLPIIEAMVAGCPVITSNIGSMAEIAGEAAHLVDPWSVGDIAKGIQKVLDETNYRNDLQSRGYEQVSRFINNRSVDKIASILDEIAHAHRHN